MQVSLRTSESVKWEYQTDSGHFVAYSPLESAQIEEMFIADDTSQCLVIFGREYRFDFKQMKQVNVATGFRRNIRRQVPSPNLKIRNPPEWTSMEGKQVKTVDLKASSSEYTEVCSKFHKTLDRQIIRVQRVQNQWLWERYKMTEQRLSRKNRGTVNEKELFHGTSYEPAMTICSSEEGFDMRFSREGLWGQANYFAVNASYSHRYSHRDGGHYEMVLAKVLAGDSYYCKPNGMLRMPPEKKQSRGDGQIQQVRYDSVTGHTNGSQVYMTYSNDLAYPAYIITYIKKPKVTLPSVEPCFKVDPPPPPPHRVTSHSISPPPPPPPPRTRSILHSTKNPPPLPKVTSHSIGNPSPPEATSHSTRNPSLPKVTSHSTRNPSLPKVTSHSTRNPSLPKATSHSTRNPSLPKATSHSTRNPSLPKATSHSTRKQSTKDPSSPPKLPSCSTASGVQRCHYVLSQSHKAL